MNLSKNKMFSKIIDEIIISLVDQSDLFKLELNFLLEF